MQFTSIAVAALSIGSAIAQSGVKVHVVRVGGSNGSLTFAPDNVAADVGDMVQFQFGPKNHSVAQSTFDSPCSPIGASSNVTGMFSGYMPVDAAATDVPTYTVMVASKTPMWLYCSQAKHCQNGMVMVINEAPAKNATRTLANYKALAAKATANITPSSSTGNGTSGSTSGSGSGSSSGSGSGSSGSDSSSGTGSTSGSGTSSGSGSASSSSSTPSPALNNSTSSAITSFTPSEALSLGGLLAIGMAVFL